MKPLAATNVRAAAAVPVRVWSALCARVCDDTEGVDRLARRLNKGLVVCTRVRILSEHEEGSAHVCSAVAAPSRPQPRPWATNPA